MIYKGILIRTEKEGKPILEVSEVLLEDSKILEEREIKLKEKIKEVV